MERSKSSATATALLSPSLNLVRALEARGIDAAALFHAAGCDLALLHVPGARVPMRVIQRVWVMAEAATADPCFGLDVAQHAQGTTSHALGYVWLASATLAEAMRRMARYARVLADAWRAHLDEEPGGTRFSIVFPDEGPRLPLSVHDALLGALVKLCRITYGEAFTPLEVTVERAQPSCASRFDEWFRAPIVWTAARPSLLCRGEDLARPLATANPDIALANERVALDYLARLDRADVVSQLRRLLVEQLPSGLPTQEEMARHLRLSPRTLHRRLAEAGTSFGALLDETRRELAASYLQRSDYSVAEVAYLVGFSEVSSFNRAFRRWTGRQPSAFRRAAAPQSNPAAATSG